MDTTKIQNLAAPFDPFADDPELSAPAQKIHIRTLQVRGPPKKNRTPHCVTVVEGLPSRFDLQKVVKHLKKKHGCAGKVVQDGEFGEVVQIQGDLKEVLEEFLVSKDGGLEIEKERVIVH